VSPLGWVAFVVAGAVGAPARYLVDGWVQDRTPGDSFPWGVLVVNVTGSFLLGLVSGLALYHGFPKVPRLVLGTGFCGAYTTFSTFTFDTVRLLEEGATATAWRYVATTVALATAAAAAGLGLAAI